MRNPPAAWSVVVGLLAVAAIPATVYYAYRSDELDLIWGGVAVPATIVLGLLAIALARRGERRANLSVVSRRGTGAARVGRLLATLALLCAGSGLTALAVYAALTYRGGT